MGAKARGNSAADGCFLRVSHPAAGSESLPSLTICPKWTAGAGAPALSLRLSGVPLSENFNLPARHEQERPMNAWTKAEEETILAANGGTPMTRGGERVWWFGFNPSNPTTTERVVLPFNADEPVILTGKRVVLTD